VNRISPMASTNLPTLAAQRLQFGPFMLDPAGAALLRDGVEVNLRRKTFALLGHLVVHTGQVVSKQDLMEHVWPGLVVTDDSLTQAISELRSALGDHGQLLIHTVARRGYRFDAPVAVAAAAAAPRIDAALAAEQSIAVMPFTDLSEPPAPHLAEAIDIDIAAGLGRIGGMAVMARGATAPLAASASSAGLDPRHIGRELGVRHILTGTVARHGARTVLTVQLASADSGGLLWSERFEFPDLAAWHDRSEICDRIAACLGTKVQDSALTGALARVHDDEALEHCMRGMYLLQRVSQPDELAQARSHFGDALAREPGCTQALAGMAKVHVVDVLRRWTLDRATTLDKAKACARAALQIDPDHPNALRALAAALELDGECEEAEIVTQRLLAERPNDADAHQQLASICYWSGRFEEAVRRAEIALRLNPLDRHHRRNCHAIAANALIALQHDSEAEAHARASGLADPSHTPYLALTAIAALRGDLVLARAQLALARRQWPEVTSIAALKSTRGGQHAAYFKGMDRYFQGLLLAGLPADDWRQAVRAARRGSRLIRRP
jgi:DNA-binding winged helix-turn-helix (wHTH) protein/tetratricopeptide (TPR) repeat protein